MAFTHRENWLRNASLQGHEWIPQGVYISGRYWMEYREEAEAVCLRHPVLFPGFQKGCVNFGAMGRQPEHRQATDAWGCRWNYELDGLDGIVIGHPLEDWARFESWQPPAPRDFPEEERRQMLGQRERGELTAVGTDHGFLFMRLYYLRGFENFMMDVAAEDPRLDRLVETVTSYWERIFRPRIEFGVDLVSAADDLGTQTASMLGSRHFRRWLMPSYKRLFLPARRAGAHVAMHHDGYIMDIMEDLIESGVSIVNPQDLVNGIDNIARAVKGRVCINLDIDRQSVIPYGSPGDVRDLIREEVLKLGSPAGGLEMIVGIYPPTPIENLDALCSAMEEHRTYWVGR